MTRGRSIPLRDAEISGIAAQFGITGEAALGFARRIEEAATQIERQACADACDNYAALLNDFNAATPSQTREATMRGALHCFRAIKEREV